MAGRLDLIDANDGPCVRSLFAALAARGWEVLEFRPYALAYLLRSMAPALPRLFRWKRRGARVMEQFIAVPGFTRLPGPSLRIVEGRRRAAERRFGKPDVVVYTLPHYAPLVERQNAPRAYFAFDAYGFYPGWNRERVSAQERRIAAAADVFFVVSKQMRMDWEGKTRGRLVYLPNATHEGFIREASRAAPPPRDLAGIRPPIAGCVGHMNASCDWNWIGTLAEQCPEISFVLLGAVTEPTPAMEEVLRRDNVHSLGNKPHADLPAYLAHFDVCLNPLSVNELNNRRCPLRLYDYLSTDAPILSTPIREAEELAAFVHIVPRAADAAPALRRALDEGRTAVREKRRAFVASHTWTRRAETLERHLEQTIPSPA
jgi:hypothetical protein